MLSGDMPAVPDSRQGHEADAVPLISVVVPVYKEEANIHAFVERAVPVLSRLGNYEILFCLDPSPDRTEALICAEIEKNSSIRLIRFSRRFGQPAATLAGILNCSGAWCAVIDVDLQDPPEVIAGMYDKAQEGFEVVTACRASRRGETLAKRLLSTVGYAVIESIAEVPIPQNTGDFRLMSRRVIEELRGFDERHGFLRGLVSLVGFSQTHIFYDRDPRHAGIGNYNRYTGSFKIGFNGIFGFSTIPLQIMMWSGFAIATLSALAIFVVVVLKIIEGDRYPMGVPTIMVLILFIGGLQLTAIGMIGEYIGRIYDEVRHRPRYIIDKVVNTSIRDAHG
jgi:polyisoprenyl-phosphate glycosyltransferase